MSITSANSVFTITVAGLFPVPVQLQAYGADRAWETGSQELTESRMSIDGKKAAGYVFNQVEQTITLQANSPSRALFTAIINAMKAAREIYLISGTITLPATGESFICTGGTLKNSRMLPNAGKVLEQMDYVIEWENIAPTLS